MTRIRTLSITLCSAVLIAGVAVFAWFSFSRVAIPADGVWPIDRSRATVVAFVGDHGTEADAVAVLDLIVEQGAQALVSQGDLGYDAPAADFMAMLDARLGKDFPFIPVLGNHDWSERDAYRDLFEARLALTPEVTCDGIIGERSVCTFQDIEVHAAIPDLSRSEVDGVDAAFLEESLSRSEAVWKICNWHKNQRAVQLGGKDNDVGWAIYETCQRHGAMIVNGHEHSYGRTHELTALSDTPRFNDLGGETALLKPGQTIVIVSGLGGRKPRKRRMFTPWWAAAYTRDEGARPGALFCAFSREPYAIDAQCRFVNIDGDVIDQFRLLTQPSVSSLTASTQ